MDHGTSTIGRYDTTGKPRLIEIDREEDRPQHMLLIGQSGTGKSTLLRNLLVEDIASGGGVGIIDPHGEEAEELLKHIPKHRREDVIYFDAADQDYPIGFNLLDSPYDKALVAQGIVGALKALWGDSWGPRMEYVLYNSLASLLECDHPQSLLGVQKMLVNSKYRHWVVKQVKDPVLKSFWVDEFENYNERFRVEVISPILNKVGQIFTNATLRNIIGQRKNKIRAERIMDEGKIFIANLSKGKLGAKASQVVGSLLITEFKLAALRRAHQKAEDRRPFYLSIDEFPSFLSDDLPEMLAECRKYKLCLVLANQFVAQMEDKKVRESVFGNVASIVAFRSSYSDAEVLTDAFSREYHPKALCDVGNYQIFARLPGEKSFDVVRGVTLPAPEGMGGSRRVKNFSQHTYGVSKSKVEERIEKWMKGCW